MERIIPIRKTRMGAVTRIHPIDDSIEVQERWGRTHGEARVSGFGKYLLVDISNLGNHSCQLIMLRQDGTQEVIEEVSKVRFCKLCEHYEDLIWSKGD